MSAKVSQELGGADAMNVSTQGELIIAKFIDTLTIREDLKSKTLKEYASDLKQFIGWFEAPEHQEEDRQFYF